VAIRQDELPQILQTDPRLGGEAGGFGRVVAFPTARVRARAVRQARHDRMMARRRRTLGALTVASILFAGVFATGPTGSSSATTGKSTRRVVVHQGDTLWSLAERYAPDGVDPRAYVDEIVALNGLEGGLAEGARIRLPK
jgi:nucleoid-associated protein YgaU